MGNIFNENSKITTTRDPYSPTTDPLNQHINMLNNQAPWTSYQGDWVADMNDMQGNALNNFASYGNTGAQLYGQNIQETGSNWMDGGNNANQFYQGALGWNPITNDGPDMDLVAKLSDNPYMTGMIDSVGRDVSRNLYENQMPGIAAASAGAGQTGSSRRGAAEAIASRGAADRLADTSATLRGAAYDKGLNIASDVSRHNADLAYNNRGQGLNAANQLQQMARTGVDMIGAGGDMRRQGYQDALTAGDRFQQQDQAEIDALRSQHMLDQQLPYDQSLAGINALMDPARTFGEETARTEKQWDGAGPVLTALLTGGGGGGNGGGDGGGNGGGLLGGLLGSAGDLVGDVLGDGPGGSTTGVLDQVGGWLGDLIGIGGDPEQTESIVRENEAAVEGAGYVKGSPGFMNIMKAVIGGIGLSEAISREQNRDGTNIPPTEGTGTDNTVSGETTTDKLGASGVQVGSDEWADIYDLIESGVSVDDAIEQVTGNRVVPHDEVVTSGGQPAVELGGGLTESEISDLAAEIEAEMAEDSIDGGGGSIDNNDSTIHLGDLPAFGDDGNIYKRGDTVPEGVVLDTETASIDDTVAFPNLNFPVSQGPGAGAIDNIVGGIVNGLLDNPDFQLFNDDGSVNMSAVFDVVRRTGITDPTEKSRIAIEVARTIEKAAGEANRQGTQDGPPNSSSGSSLPNVGSNIPETMFPSYYMGEGMGVGGFNQGYGGSGGLSDAFYASMNIPTAFPGDPGSYDIIPPITPELLDNFFSSNPEAAAMKDQMLNYYENLPRDEFGNPVLPLDENGNPITPNFNGGM
jgi:hypothetical protein